MLKIKWIRETLGTSSIFWGIILLLTLLDGWIRDPLFITKLMENFHFLTGISQGEVVIGLIMIPVISIGLGLIILFNKEIKKWG